MAYIETTTEQDHEREASIRKFGKFIHDIPFFDAGIKTYDPVEIYQCNIDAMTDGLLNNLRPTEAVLMSKALSDQLEGGEEDGYSFSRIAARNGQNSRHGVFFGKISLCGSSVAVAAKMFPDVSGSIDRKAVEETVKSHAVINHGVRTYEPLMLGRYDGMTYSISALEYATSTLDSIDWTNFAKAPRANPGMVNQLKMLADLTAKIHNKDWGHGDWYPRNIALDVRGKEFAIDWEDAIIGKSTGDTEVAYAHAFKDLLALGTSFYHSPDHRFNPGIGLLTNVKKDEAVKIFDDYFMGHYLQARVAATSGEFREDVVMLKKDMRELPDMIGHS